MTLLIRFSRCVFANSRRFVRAFGVQITTIKEGDGINFPQRGDSLTMHYTGRLASNQQKFDSSVDRGQPFVYVISQIANVAHILPIS